MLHAALDRCEDLAGVVLEPMAVEGLGRDPKLDDQVRGEVLGRDLAAFFPPEADKCGFIIAHDNAGVKAANEVAAIGRLELPTHETLHALRYSPRRVRGCRP